MAVIYADGVFFINAMIDYLLCLITARLAGIPLRRKRYLGAAFLGGLYGTAAIFPEFEILTTCFIKLILWFLIALIAYGASEQFLKLAILLGIVSCAMAGCVLGLSLLMQKTTPSSAAAYFLPDINAGTVCLTMIGAWLIASSLFRSAARAGCSKQLLQTRICILGRTETLTTLLDTGNHLSDPVSGQPVLIVAAGTLNAILPGTIKEVVTPEGLKKPVRLLEPIRALFPELCPNLMPYRAVGVTSGMLLTIRSDWIEINGTKYRNGVIAFAPTPLGTGYSALWGGDMKGDINHGHSVKHPDVAPNTAE